MRRSTRDDVTKVHGGSGLARALADPSSGGLPLSHDCGPTRERLLRSRAANAAARRTAARPPRRARRPTSAVRRNAKNHVWTRRRFDARWHSPPPPPRWRHRSPSRRAKKPASKAPPRFGSTAAARASANSETIAFAVRARAVVSGLLVAREPDASCRVLHPLTGRGSARRALGRCVLQQRARAAGCTWAEPALRACPAMRACEARAPRSGCGGRTRRSTSARVRAPREARTRSRPCICLRAEIWIWASAALR